MKSISLLLLFLALFAICEAARHAHVSTKPSINQSINRLPLKSIVRDESVQAAQSLISRYYPDHVKSFHLSIVTKKDQSSPDYFTLSTNDQSTNQSIDQSIVVNIEGTSANMLTAGFNHYLREYQSINLLTWSTKIVPPMPPLQPIDQSIKVEFPYLMRYWYNICTLSYTTAFWQWSDWEREIDWMALRGINFPLALGGQEVVWLELFGEMGLNSTEINSFLAGPAFLAWQRMGNIQGWGNYDGSLNFFTKVADLQKKMLDRMRELDMMPILAGFNGYVPTALKTHYPDAKIAPSSTWAGFPVQYVDDDLLDPSDPLFITIGKRYIELQTQRYGTDHFYNSDTYNENAPSTNNTTYLASVSAAVYQAMTSADPEAVWVMQGWLFVNDASFWQPAQIKAYLDPVPNDSMIILDLMSDIDPIFSKVNNYYGKMFIWCMLHNFGGSNGMGGFIDIISSAPSLAKLSVGAQLIGLGSTPEGTLNNELIYDFLFDMAKTDQVVDPYAWLKSYVKARYTINDQALAQSPKLGKAYDELLTAYQILLGTAYNCTNLAQWGVLKSIIETVPSMAMNNTGFQGNMPWFSLETIERVVILMVGVESSISDFTPTALARYRYDVVDFSKQWFAMVMKTKHQQMVECYLAKNLNCVQSLAQTLIEIIDETDQLLGSDGNFLLGTWIEQARSYGDSVSDANNLEFNARNQITMWGMNEEINDYASKQWNGLVGNYYKPRWQMFLDTVVDAVKQGKAWNPDAYNAAKLIIEQRWQTAKEKFITVPQGNPVQLVQDLLDKYGSI